MILKGENIHKAFGKRKVLTGVSINLERGKIYGIAGENGSGKSTLLKSLIGYSKIDKGKVKLYGSFGYCPQSPHFFDQLTIEEHFNYFAVAYGIEKEQKEENVQFFLKELNFEKYFKVKIKELSGGTIQKLNLSVSLLNFPDLLVLDEPYNGFDWDTYLKFWDLTQLLKERETAIVIVSHFINDLNKFDTTYELKNGQLYEVE